MSIESKIDHYAALVRTKISHLSMRLLGLEDAQIAAALVQEIQPIVDALGTYVPEYCLPDLCTGELPTFPVPEFNPNSPPPYSSIPDVPLPPKAPK